MLKQTVAAGALLLVAACSQDAGSSRAGNSAADAFMTEPAARGMQKTADMAVRASTTSQSAAVDRKTIRTAEIRVELDDVGRGARAVDSIVSAAQGFVANTHRSQGDGGYAEASLTLRVPAERFAEAMEALRALGRVRVDNTSAEDVTRSYNDLTIRLAVKRDMVTRLRALLANQAAKLSDLVQVERELGRAITELEQMEGERRFLDNQIAMSTINVSLYHAPIAGPGGVLDPVMVALRDALRVLGQSLAAIISVGVFLLPWIVIAVVSWSLWRVRRRRLPAATPNT